MTFKQFLKQHKFSIILVISFVIAENLAWIIEPTFFGKLLDALIDKFYDHEKVKYTMPLIIWIIVYLLNVIFGFFSRLLSGRIYSRVYADLASSIIVSSKNAGHPVSKTLARAELAKGYMVFLRERLPEITWQLVATFGAIIALFFYDWRIAMVCILVIFPVFYINNLYRKNVVKLQKDINDTQEDLYKLFEDKDISKVSNYYQKMLIPQIKIAKWSSFDYGIVKIILMVIFIFVLFICIDVDKFSTGKIYAIVSYLWTFIASTDYLPGLMEGLSSVKELSNRLRE